MINLISKLTAFIALLAVISFTACDKSDELTTEEATVNFTDEALFVLQQEGNLGPEGCFELVFPITIEFPDETTLAADNYDELSTALRTWKEENPGLSGMPSFVFPVEVISEDGELISVDSRQELRELREECPNDYFGKNRPKGHHGKCKPCFEFVFPLTIVFPDETTEEVANRMELKDLLREWKENNPGATERPEIVFPIEVILKDGTTVEVGSAEALKELRKGCRPGIHPPKPCFKFVFPLTFEFPDGTTEEVADPKEMHELIRAWKENNPGATERPEIVFPIEVILEDGTTVEVESEEGLKELREGCN